MASAICWADMPVKDLDRAISFYEKVLKLKITKQSYDGGEFAFFDHKKEGDVGGCLVKNPST